MPVTQSDKRHDPAILVLAGLILVGLLGLPPCNNSGCGSAFCFVFPNTSTAKPMGFQGVDPAYISRQQKEIPVVSIPPAQLAFPPADSSPIEKAPNVSQGERY